MEPSRPQSPAVRGFPRFWNRSLRCTLRGVFAVSGEREEGADPRNGGLFKVTVQQSIEKFAVFNYPKK